MQDLHQHGHASHAYGQADMLTGRFSPQNKYSTKNKVEELMFTDFKTFRPKS